MARFALFVAASLFVLAASQEDCTDAECPSNVNLLQVGYNMKKTDKDTTSCESTPCAPGEYCDAGQCQAIPAVPGIDQVFPTCDTFITCKSPTPVNKGAGVDCSSGTCDETQCCEAACDTLGDEAACDSRADCNWKASRTTCEPNDCRSTCYNSKNDVKPWCPTSDDQTDAKCGWDRCKGCSECSDCSPSPSPASCATYGASNCPSQELVADATCQGSECTAEDEKTCCKELYVSRYQTHKCDPLTTLKSNASGMTADICGALAANDDRCNPNYVMVQKDPPFTECYCANQGTDCGGKVRENLYDIYTRK